jgi:hypothetical protein
MSNIIALCAVSLAGGCAGVCSTPAHMQEAKQKQA